MHVMLNMATADRVIHNRQELVRAYLARTVDAAINASACQTVLLSGELLSAWMSSETVEWLKSLDSRHSVTIIAFVRDIYDQTVSYWKQGVKTSSTSADLDAFVKSQSLKQKKNALRNVAMLADSDFDLRLINYDHHKAELFDALFREIGVETAGVDLYRGENRLFNPSISYRQAKMISLASQSAGLSRLSALLLNQFRTSVDRRKDPVFTDIDLSLLDDFKSELCVLNRLLPEGEKLRVLPRPADVHNEAGMFDADDLSLLFESFGNLLHNLRQAQPRLQTKNRLNFRQISMPKNICCATQTSPKREWTLSTITSTTAGSSLEGIKGKKYRAAPLLRLKATCDSVKGTLPAERSSATASTVAAVVVGQRRVTMTAPIFPP